MDGMALVAAGWVTMAVATGVGGEAAGDRARDHPSGGPTVDRTESGARRSSEQLDTSPAGSSRPAQPELKVIVYSEVDIPWLAAAQQIAAGLFDEAGIRVVWIRCGESAADAACHRPPAQNELVVRIRRQRLDRASPTCGVAFRPRHMVGSYVTLFLDCLIEGANTFRLAEPIVAGYCLAHEIGHLLLPTGAHAPSGIMQARLSLVDWDRAARGGLRFRPPERRQMLEALHRRLASQGMRTGNTQNESDR